MRKSLIICFTCLVYVFIFSQMAFSESTKTKVTILGSLHNYHNQLKNYNFNTIKNLISSKNPDIICIEVTPEHYKSLETTWAPSEYKVLLPFLLNTGAKIEPFDWVTDDWNKLLVEQKKLSEDPKTSELFNSIINPLELILNHIKEEPISELDYKFYNSDFIDDWIESSYKLLEYSFPSNVVSKVTSERNKNMSRLL